MKLLKEKPIIFGEETPIYIKKMVCNIFEELPSDQHILKNVS